MTHTPVYVMADTDASSESDRLGLLESSRDPGTIARLKELGVGAGWRCLEVGAGRGSITRWLAEQVGSTGAVVALDIDTRFLDDMPGNVEVRALDIREQGAEPGAYDLVHCRALLMHLPDPATVLARLAMALRSGGVLLAEEGDYGLYHYGGHPDADALNEMSQKTFGAIGKAGISNLYFGRTLPAMMAACGLELLGTEVDTRVSRPGEPHYEFTRATALASLAPLVDAGVMQEANAKRLENYFGHPGSVITGPSLIAAWGQRHG